MGEIANTNESSDIFENERVSELWLDISELTDDPTVAKQVILECARTLWNLPWATYEQLAKQAASI